MTSEPDAGAPGRTALRVQIFGRTQAWRDGSPIELGTTRQRSVFGLLALHAGQPVTRSELAGMLWPDELPSSAVNTIQTYVKRLRRVLEPGRPQWAKDGLLATVGDGYLLQVDPAVVDVLQAGEMFAAAEKAYRRADYAAARALVAQALDLYRAAPAADLPLLAELPSVTALADQRWAAIGVAADAALRQGGATDLLSLLEEAARAKPLDEAVHHRLIRAYAVAGRRADAIEVFHRIRHRLAEELGVDPDTAMLDAYQELLEDTGRSAVQAAASRSMSTLAAVPCQLPPPVGHFTGRRRQLEDLKAALLRDADGPKLSVVAGAGGVGKTALALEVGRQLRHHFPDGQMFLDLRGHDPAASMSPGEAIAYLLRSLGVSREQLPARSEEQVALYRTLVEGRRLLVVLDNAHSSDQVLSLVPPASTAAVVVTSRNRLHALSTYQAVQQTRLDPMTVDEAISLLGSIIGADRLAAEATEAVQLVRLCGRLPLALRIAGAKLAAREAQSLREFVHEISDEQQRLSRLEVEGSARSVRTAFASSYRSLPPTGGRVFRLLGAAPIHDFRAELVATLAGVDHAGGWAAVEDLTSTHLVEEKHGRFRFHDLVRIYARERAQAEEPAARLEEARRGVLRWYLALAASTSRELSLFPFPLDIADYPDLILPEVSGQPSIVSLLDDERPNLLPLIRYAVAEGRHQEAWQLVQLLSGYFINRGPGADGTEMGRLGLRAAEASGDPIGTGLMCSFVAMCHLFDGDHAAAVTHLDEAMELFRRHGSVPGEAIALKTCSLLAGLQGQFESAIDYALRAIALFEQLAEVSSVGRLLNNVGDLYNQLGRPQEAQANLRRALEIARGASHRRDEAMALTTMGESFQAGRDPRAIQYFEQAVSVYRELGERRLEADALRLLAEARRLVGDDAQALAAYGAALPLYRELGHLRGVIAVQEALGRIHLDPTGAGGVHLAGPAVYASGGQSPP